MHIITVFRETLSKKFRIMKLNTLVCASASIAAFARVGSVNGRNVLAFSGSSFRGIHSFSGRTFTYKNMLATVNLPGNSLRMLFGNFGKKSIDYDILEGSAKEAAEAAIQGKVPAKSKDGWDIATFAGGCFWGLELALQRVNGVMSTHVGYTQGKTDMPTYEEVCSGMSGHTEAVQVYFDPRSVSFQDLLEVFLSRIDPTQVNGQGNDRGSQYRTGVYAHSEQQRKEMEEFFGLVKNKYSQPIATELKDATVFYPAEKYHQQYLSTGGRFGAPQSAEKGCTDKIRCYG